MVIRFHLFDDIFRLYQFDQELSALVFSMISKIEVALRVRLVEALLVYGDALILQDSSIFKEKKDVLAEYVYNSIRNFPF